MERGVASDRVDDGLPVDTARQRARIGVVADLESLLRRAPALKFACVGSADGRLLASVGSGNGNRLAAMTSSMLALGESCARDALGSRCDYAVVSTSAGAIVIVRLPHQGTGYMLSIGSDGSEVLASTLRAALDTAARIAAILARNAG
jgi:predicted regulator of Ras-like GTPase activity (Roadblock/LC7/MglB family)